MANDLTGDFDVIAEFSVLAVNRLLAAMHSGTRFLHSITVRVDDNPPPGARVDRPTILGSVDSFGDPTVDHTTIGTLIPPPGWFVATDPIYAALDGVVNTDVVGATVGPLVPSRFQGRAQLQLSPPAIEVPDASGTNITVRMNIMSRYLPDPHTSALAEFIRGDLQITAAVNQIASGPANVIDIDFKADQAYINFTPSWWSQSLSPEDLAGINLLIRNALKTSFLPSNAALPPNIQHVEFRTLLAPPSAIGVLLNMTGPAGNAAAFNSIFLGGGDDFGFAVGIDYLRALLQPIIDNIVSQSYSVTIPVDVLASTYHVVYAISLSSGTLDLPNGTIVLTMQGQAAQTSHKWYAPGSFSFTAQMTFGLTVDGATADLTPGDVSLDTSSWIVNLFKNSATDGMKQVRDAALEQSGAYNTVRDMFDANKNVGDFLNSLLTPADPRRPLAPSHELQLTYTSVEIRPSGIILHGSLAVTDPQPVATLGIGAPGALAAAGWPPPYVEFEQIPTRDGGGVVGTVVGIAQGPDYSALKSWIPGGTIEQYEWSLPGAAQPYIDNHTFVLIPAPPAVLDGTPSATPSPPQQPTVSSGYTPLCLTVRGSRYSSSGPVVKQPVSASVCGYSTFPTIPAGLMSSLKGAVPLVALTQSGPRGLLQVVGHTPGRLDHAEGDPPNLIVHFANERTAGHLEFLTQALRDSGREDAATAVLAVLTPDQFAQARHVDGVIYAEAQGGAWARVFAVKTTRAPVTLIADPKGHVVWQHEGELDSTTLTAVLRRVLVTGGFVRPRMPWLNLRLGRPAPNFLFELAPGQQLTLRKLTGRAIILAFWTSASKPSLEVVRDLQKSAGTAEGQGPVVLAINDGDAVDLARRVAAENRLSAIVVTDPKRTISLAYGVNIWPSIVFIDASGVVTQIRYGRHEHRGVDSSRVIAPTVSG